MQPKFTKISTECITILANANNKNDQ